MKRYIFISLIITIGFVIISSCTSFLQYTPYSMSVGDFWKTESDAVSAANGLYFFNMVGDPEGRGLEWYENASDNMVTGRPKAQAELLRDFLDNGSTDRDVNQVWPDMYQLIRRCNDILHYVPTMNISQSVKNNVLGQAYFFRGFAYLWIAPWYGDNNSGGIPIMTENTPVDSMDMPRPASVLSNYRMIMSDFSKAASLVPWFQDLTSDQYGRPHKTACWALAARAALYASQFDSKYLATCSTYCDSVIQTGRHQLLSNYADLWQDVNNYSSEYLWNWPSSALSGSELPGVTFENTGFGYYNTWGYYQPTLELYQSFQTGDKRLKATIIYPGDTVSFIGHQIIYGVNPPSFSSTTGMTWRKYISPYAAADCIGKTVNSNGDYPTTTLCPPVIRYADVLLMKAEAIIWQGQNGDKWLNMVRNRAGLSSITNAAKVDLKRERRCELAFEPGPWRFLDLVRWGDAQTALQPQLHGVTVTHNVDGSISVTQGAVVSVARTFNPSVDDVWAIPIAAINASKVLVQNKGY
jgi:hypothetical protein